MLFWTSSGTLLNPKRVTERESYFALSKSNVSFVHELAAVGIGCFKFWSCGFIVWVLCLTRWPNSNCWTRLIGSAGMSRCLVPWARATGFEDLPLSQNKQNTETYRWTLGTTANPPRVWERERSNAGDGDDILNDVHRVRIFSRLWICNQLHKHWPIRTGV